MADQPNIPLSPYPKRQPIPSAPSGPPIRSEKHRLHRMVLERDRKEKARAKLAFAAVKAADALVYAATGGETTKDQVRAADSILDRTLGKATQVIEQTVRHDIDAVELSDTEILARLEASGVPVPTRLRRIIDVEPELSTAHNECCVKVEGDPEVSTPDQVVDPRAP